MLYGELTPFIASGAHCLQKQLIPHSSLTSFVEALSQGKPTPLYLRPQLLAYLAKNHCLWHRSIVLLEASLPYATSSHGQQHDPNWDTSAVAQHETFAALSQLFGQLREDDLRAGLWLAKTSTSPSYSTALALHHHQSHLLCHEVTKLALVHEQQGLFYQVGFPFG